MSQSKVKRVNCEANLLSNNWPLMKRVNRSKIFEYIPTKYLIQVSNMLQVTATMVLVNESNRHTIHDPRFDPVFSLCPEVIWCCNAARGMTPFVIFPCSWQLKSSHKCIRSAVAISDRSRSRCYIKLSKRCLVKLCNSIGLCIHH